MHPFGGTSKCARCDKAVYLAEQVIGPGRKLYHKPCLACTSCSKRLDSLSLLEHNQEPYCKPCHVKLFGTRDLRQANLPYRAVSPPLSPSNGTAQMSSPLSPLSSPTRARSFATGNGGTPRLQGNRSLFPITSFPPTTTTEFDEEAEEPGDLAENNLARTPVSSSASSLTVSSNITGLSQSVADGDKFTLGKIQTPTGTRYGAALGGGVVTHSTGSPRKWGGNTPSCPKCGKSVFFAEQVKAVGKTYHKACLRCSECNTTLDSSKLRDHEGTPFCSRCYNKLSFQRIEAQSQLVLSREIGMPNIAAKGKLQPRTVSIPSFLAPPASEAKAAETIQVNADSMKKPLIEEIITTNTSSSGSEIPAIKKQKGILKSSSAPALQAKSVQTPIWSWFRSDSDRLQIQIEVPPVEKHIITLSYIDIEPRRLIFSIPNYPMLDINLSLSDAELVARSERGSSLITELASSTGDNGGSAINKLLRLKRQRPFDVGCATAEWIIAENKLLISV